MLEARLLFLAADFSCLDDISNLSLTASLFDLQGFIRFGSPAVLLALHS